MRKQFFLMLLSLSFALFGAEKDNCPKHAAEIKRLNEQHALEIKLWEEKVAVLLAEREQTATLKAEREAALIHCQQPVRSPAGIRKEKDNKSKK